MVRTNAGRKEVERLIRSGARMQFLTLEDLYGFCDVVFFPKIFNKYRDIICGNEPFTVTGILPSRMKGEANLVAEKIVQVS